MTRGRSAFLPSIDGVCTAVQRSKHNRSYIRGGGSNKGSCDRVGSYFTCSVQVIFAEILEESDGIMVTKRDLGVEVPYSKVSKAQKDVVSACNETGKPVVVATQMLDSMMRNPRPTRRAEVTDGRSFGRCRCRHAVW